MSDQTANLLLRNLPSDEWKKIGPRLIPTPLVTGHIIIARGQTIHEIYLVESGMISLTVMVADGSETEVALVGFEGAAGVQAMLGSSHASATTRAVVQASGQAMRLNDTRVTLAECPIFERRCYAYIDRLVNQIAQVAGCNLRHSISERLCRWLLMMRDRLQTETLPITHDFLAIMLGVRRSGVSLALGSLQHAGLIRQSHGIITVIDSAGLERSACGCYPVVRALFESSTTDGE